ncbi:protein-tyrosine phosphatase-like protein [Lipomyces oligophaga]|uniref:protein-tyrosine phosphatase-like protein n=1 Tax=Lipomyces oligophaga TaxID=45792 RepID=UPI0034CDD526
MAMHKIEPYEIYLGSLFALRGKKAIQDAHISHVLSAVNGKLDLSQLPETSHLHVDIEDDEDTDLLQHLEHALAFMDEAISSGGAVLVHCMAGVSRSASIVCAYIMRDRQILFDEALELVRHARPIANPNDSFREQLAIFASDGYVVNEDSTGYRRWKLKMQALESTAAGMAPIPMTYNTDTTDSTSVELRCRKCRCPLASSGAVISHIPTSSTTTQAKYGPGMVSILPATCMHYFLDPVRWMQPELERGELEGKLECPKCKTKVGSYRWQGMKCSCGQWVTPGISLQRGRVDEIRRIAAKA